MKHANILTLLLIAAMLFSGIVRVAAQSQSQLISLHPLTSDVRSALEIWIATSAPVQAPFYSETYVEQSGYDYFVSLAALNISSPDEEWKFVEEDDTPSKVLWIGSVKVLANGLVIPLFTTEQASTINHVRGAGALLPAAGGGNYLLFPFDAGSFVIFGPRGVHGSGDYGTSGMVAVDLVSGDDLGGSAASAAVYASDAGTVDYVCDDGTTTAIRTHNSSTGDYFVYAHMLDNENLAMSHEFAQGEYIGSLKYGSFDDTCGWAEQASNHYHNHWMFKPSGGNFQVENYILDTGSEQWSNGTQTVGVGGKLYGGGGAGGNGIDDPTTTGGVTNKEKSFWDFVLIGMVSFFDRGLLKLLPEHNSPAALLLGVMNMVRIFFRLVWTLTRFNLNLGPIMALLAIVLGFRLITGVVWLAFAVLRTIKAIPGL